MAPVLFIKRCVLCMNLPFTNSREDCWGESDHLIYSSGSSIWIFYPNDIPIRQLAFGAEQDHIAPQGALRGSSSRQVISLLRSEAWASDDNTRVWCSASADFLIFWSRVTLLLRTHCTAHHRNKRWQPLTIRWNTSTWEQGGKGTGASLGRSVARPIRDNQRDAERGRQGRFHLNQGEIHH